MTEPVLELVFDRLAADPAVPADVADLVLAALSSDDDLATALAGTPTRLDPPATGHAEQRRVWLKSITDADRRLLRAAGPHEAGITEVRGQRAPLAATLDDVADERARRAAALLRRRGPADLPALTAILDEPDEGSAEEPVRRCRQLADLSLPGVDEVARLARELRDAVADVLRHDGGRSRAALRGAELLRLALEHHADGGDGPCPVCRTGALHGGWRVEAEATVAALRRRSLAAQTASTRLTALLRQAHHLIDDLPLAVTQNPAEEYGTGGDAPPVRALTEAIALLRRVPGDPVDLADHLQARYPALVAAAYAARAYAEGVLRQQDTGWQAAAGQLRAWVTAAGALAAREATLARLKAARVWLTDTGAALGQGESQALGLAFTAAPAPPAGRCPVPASPGPSAVGVPRT
ncbi:hypothetical protein [Micromonospora halophytica]|uniref:Uncharacterized protein n=1 Tax=Micromonospora halophytica TaxID=47864 RepID=A0A1C5JIJ3_9ACTN|nr:hypothetical protein [Micromonospora halophytica]SCG70293.1 hypothetical protein GA0070560_1348 [Micromonospora halophytica]